MNNKEEHKNKMYRQNKMNNCAFSPPQSFDSSVPNGQQPASQPAASLFDRSAGRWLRGSLTRPPPLFRSLRLSPNTAKPAVTQGSAPSLVLIEKSTYRAALVAVETRMSFGDGRFLSRSAAGRFGDPGRDCRRDDFRFSRLSSVDVVDFIFLDRHFTEL